ncbi:pfkB family carbohydrate kinase-like protein [Hyaloscypha hepaticicola]|uniref:PfkB family carbohydrate kinase-like protein n=1 Tax=Hyaloscypha hepaticicola TaxID=2082293 RepID=A0A2J6QAL5_9HELO|nr:pfkB family carbohydrate kinase-like protein [Hyaloscypha hepaticicola]
MEEEDEVSPSQEIDFCTLGMFIIDEIHYLPPKPSVFDILGGSGCYSALGARLFSPPPLSHTVSWIVDKGSDFPEAITTEIKSWETSCLIRSDSSRLTTRGWNGYDSKQTRAFKYTTPKLRLDEHALTPSLLFSRSFYLNCSPTRCIDLVTSILRRRKTLNPGCPKPLFIWEPVPDLCTPSELLNCTNALPYVDVCSPNHSELAAFMGDPDLGMDPLTGKISTQSVERACEQLLSSMPLQSYTLVIRCGEKGVYLAKNGGRSRRPSMIKKKRPANRPRGGLTLDMDMEALFAGLLGDDGELEREVVPIDPGLEMWLPAYFGKENAEMVVDPTGGGNGFLGGLAVALARGKEIQEAAAWGSVAASFAVEQVGMPILGKDEMGRETWNGALVEERLDEYVRKARGRLV